MNNRKIAIQLLTDAGYTLKRNGGNHDIYFSTDTKCTIPLKRHELSEGDLLYIKKEIKQNRERKG